MTEDDQSAELFLQLFIRHEPELRAFVRASLPRSNDVDDVMQEVSLVAWKKFASLTDVAQFPRWACWIARFEILKFRRRWARDRLVLDEALVELLAAEGAEEMPLRKRQLAVLDDCISKLPAERRQLTLAAYSQDTTVRALAKRMGRSENALYQLLARIRHELLHCLQRTLAMQLRD